MTGRKKLVIAVFALILIMLFWIVPGMGHYLVVEDPLEEADLIVVLMGSVTARVLEAADIYGGGFARELVMVQSYVEAAEELARRGVKIPGYAELTRDAAMQMGVPESRIIILPGEARSTKDEALVLREYLEQNSEIERIILVTSSFHSRRTKIIFERFCGGLARNVQFISRPSKYDAFQPQRWWLNRESAEMVVLEYQKLGHFYLLERWQ